MQTSILKDVQIQEINKIQRIKKTVGREGQKEQFQVLIYYAEHEDCWSYTTELHKKLSESCRMNDIHY